MCQEGPEAMAKVREFDSTGGNDQALNSTPVAPLTTAGASQAR